MKFTAAFASALLASIVAAAPHRSGSGRGGNGQGKGGKGNGNSQTATCGSGAAAAAYFMTNEATGNFVVTNTIGPDGKVTTAHAFFTGGNGSAGQVAAPGPDALFTQDSVKVGGNFLFAVNSGSNTLTMFNINQQDPTVLQMVGMPQDTQGEFPVAVAFTPQGNKACVVNGGANNGITCFTADAKSGLTPIENTTRSLAVNQTTPPTGPAGSISDIIFSADGSRLTVSVKGVPPTPGFLATWDVAADGSLSQDFVRSIPATGGLLPFSLSLIPGKPDALLATDPAAGFSTFNFAGNDGANASSVIIPVENQGAICWSNFSPKTGTVFMTDILTSTVTEAKVNDDLTATIVKQYALAAGSGTIDNAIATIGGNDFLYVLSANKTSIDVLSLAGEGQASPIQTLDFSGAAADMKLTISPFHVQGMAVFPSTA